MGKWSRGTAGSELHELMERGFDLWKRQKMVITDWWEGSGIAWTDGLSGYGWSHYTVLASRCGMSRELPDQGADGRGGSVEWKPQSALRRGRGYSDLNYLLLKAQRLAATKTEFVAIREAV